MKEIKVCRDQCAHALGRSLLKSFLGKQLESFIFVSQDWTYSQRSVQRNIQN